MSENLPATIDWANELKGAAALIKSGLVPPAIKTPEAALFVILTGRDLGLSAVQSLRSIKPIQGKIELSADVQLGLFQRSGGRFRWLQCDENGAQLELHAPWLTQPHVSTFGPEEAKRAELMSNPNYRKYPKAMYRSRAITQGLKDIGYLATSGVYAPGELSDAAVVDVQTGEVLPAQTVEPEAPMLPKREISTTAGTAEALSDEERSRLMDTALAISEALQDGSEVSAWKLWDGLDNDQKTVVWGVLTKDVRKLLRPVIENMRQAEQVQA